MGFFKKIFHAVAKITKSIVSVITAPIKWAGKATKWIGKKIGGDVGKIIESGGKIGEGFAKSVEQGAASFIEDLSEGRIGKALKNVLDLVASAVIIIAGIVTYNPYIIAAGVTYFDYRYGDAGFIIRPVTNVTTGILEDTGLVKNARMYREEIVAIVGITAGILASYGASAYIQSLSISDEIINIINAISSINSAVGAYQSYVAYERLSDELRDKLNELIKYYSSLAKEKKEAFDLFLNQGLNFKLYDWFAGGKIYNSFSAGNQNYDFISVKNPWFMVLGESEEKSKQYEDLKPYLAYKSLNTYDDFFERTLKVDSLFNIERIN